jgi:hypothetical protein
LPWLIDMSENREKIFQVLKDKGSMKQEVYRNTLGGINHMKQYLGELSVDLKDRMSKVDDNVLIELEDRGDFELRLKLGGDVIIFLMHTNVFEFEDSHTIQSSEYVKKDPLRAYCGLISIYNFLADSFKYNRENDLGYLIARVFVNRENHFFVEGKRQLGFLYNDFAKQELDMKKAGEVIESSILYSLDFDLLTPPYNNVMEVSVNEVNAVSQAAKMKTGKRLGFKFHTEQDVT